MLDFNFDPKKDKIKRCESIALPAVQEEQQKTLGRRRRRANKKLSPEALEMVDIRNKLGMSQHDFAVALGESKDKIVNIENGRLKKVPETLLRQSRDLLESEKDTRVHPLAELENLSMKELMDRWWSMIGARNDKEAAILLGITMTTINRWRNTQTRPSGGDLLRYELIAKKISSRGL